MKERFVYNRFKTIFSAAFVVLWKLAKISINEILQLRWSTVNVGIKFIGLAKTGEWTRNVGEYSFGIFN